MLISLVTDEQEKAENHYSHALSPAEVLKSLTRLKFAVVNISTLFARDEEFTGSPCSFLWGWREMARHVTQSQ